MRISGPNPRRRPSVLPKICRETSANMATWCWSGDQAVGLRRRPLSDGWFCGISRTEDLTCTTVDRQRRRNGEVTTWRAATCTSVSEGPIFLRKVSSLMDGFGGRNSSVGSVLGSLSCMMQRRGFDPPLRRFFGRGDFSLGVNHLSWNILLLTHYVMGIFSLQSTMIIFTVWRSYSLI